MIITQINRYKHFLVLILIPSILLNACASRAYKNNVFDTKLEFKFIEDLLDLKEGTYLVVDLKDDSRIEGSYSKFVPMGIQNDSADVTFGGELYLIVNEEQLLIHAGDIKNIWSEKTDFFGGNPLVDVIKLYGFGLVIWTETLTIVLLTAFVLNGCVITC